jgi:hypothetical protein
MWNRRLHFFVLSPIPTRPRMASGRRGERDRVEFEISTSLSGLRAYPAYLSCRLLLLSEGAGNFK